MFVLNNNRNAMRLDQFGNNITIYTKSFNSSANWEGKGDDD